MFIVRFTLCDISEKFGRGRNIPFEMLILRKSLRSKYSKINSYLIVKIELLYKQYGSIILFASTTLLLTI